MKRDRVRERDREIEAAAQQTIIQFRSESALFSIQLTACVATCLLLTHNIHVYCRHTVCLYATHSFR